MSRSRPGDFAGRPKGTKNDLLRGLASRGGDRDVVDTRTNAGLDNIAIFRKTFTYENPGERAIALLCSGNLSVTQEVRTKLSRAMKDAAAEPDAGIETLLNCSTLHRAAHLVGDAMKAVQSEMREGMSGGEGLLGASILVAGQRKGGKLRLYMVYSEGNFIEATADTPFFQIGEHKYGKPILDRIIRPDTSLSDAAKCVSASRWIRRCARICRWACRSI